MIGILFKPRTLIPYSVKKLASCTQKTKTEERFFRILKIIKKLNYDELVEEKFERKSYFSEMNIENSKIMFKVKNKVFPPIRKNFPRKYRVNSLLCPSCRNLDLTSQKEDSQKHLITECPAFDDFRMNRDLKNNDLDIVEFFKDVMEYKIFNG